MYIANVTQQDMDFQYRIPSNPRSTPLQQKIPAMGQIKIADPPGGELTKPDIDAIVDAHQPYGMRRVNELKHGIGFHGLVYDIDRPLNVESIRRGHVVFKELLEDKGKALREEAAIAINNRIEDQATPRGATLEGLEVSIEEQKGMNGEDPKMASSIRVDRSAPGPEGARQRAPTRAPRKRA